MSNPKNVLIVIANYSGKQLLQKHLSSILSTNYFRFDIVVVDNGSTDDSIDFLEKNYPTVRIVKNDKNVGFGRANNIGVRNYPNYDFYAFVNNDISVDKDWLDKLVSVAENESVGAVGSKILYSQKRDGEYVINSAGIEIDKHYFGYDRYDGEIDSEKFNTVEEVDALTGAVLLIPRNVWNEVGGFDERFFLYYEDVDLSLRIHDLGYSLMYCGNSVVYHDHMGSTHSLGSFRRNLMNMKNRYLSIGNRKGFLVALSETAWYLLHWFTWKLVFQKKITLKEYLSKYNE